MQEQAKTEIEKDSIEWKNYLRDNSQNFEAPVKREVPITALIITISFIAGGLLALLPYLLRSGSNEAFILSIWTNVPVLLIAGAIKSQVNGESVLWGSLRFLFLGLAIALLAYFIAGIFAN